jgi:hypothetical protein
LGLRAATGFFSRAFSVRLLGAPHFRRLERAEPLAPRVARLLGNSVPLRDHRHRIAIRRTPGVATTTSSTNLDLHMRTPQGCKMWQLRHGTQAI